MKLLKNMIIIVSKKENGLSSDSPLVQLSNCIPVPLPLHLMQN